MNIRLINKQNLLEKFIGACFIFFSVSAIYAHGVLSDTSVRVRLKLLQSGAGEDRQIAVSVSVTNNSESDVYIPGLHNQLDPVLFLKTEDGYMKYPPSDSSLSHGEVLGEDFSNEFSRQYSKRGMQIYNEQYAIFDTFANIHPDQANNLPFIPEMPVFIKAHQTIDNFVVFPFKRPNYKISQYKLLCIYSPKNPYTKKEYSRLWPEKIGSFKKIIPDAFESNAVYYEL